MAEKTISLIVPAYKQEKTIQEDIRNLDESLKMLGRNYELIVVVDGFVDKTHQLVKSLKIKSLKVEGYKENQGKGFAIKYGVDKANGDIIGYIDSGMDLDPKEIRFMLDIFDWNDADIVIGSKLHPDSKVNYPTFRRILSFGYRLLVKMLFRFDVKDTQVGLKIYRRRVAKEVFPKIVVKRFAFDVEVLAVARMLGFTKIYEAPVKLRFRPGSITSVNFLRTITLMLIDTIAVFYRMKLLHYYDNKK